MTKSSKKNGYVFAAQDPVVDVRFKDPESLPALSESLRVKTFDGRTIILQVAEHLDNNLVRCVSLGSTMNLRRNAEVEADGAPLSIPVGEELFDRIINASGEPIDNKGEIKTALRSEITRCG